MSGDMAGVDQGTLTAAAELGAKSGTWSWCGAIYLNDGGIIGTSAQGTIEEVGKHKWRLVGSPKPPRVEPWASRLRAILPRRRLPGSCLRGAKHT